MHRIEVDGTAAEMVGRCTIRAIRRFAAGAGRRQSAGLTTARRPTTIKGL